MAINCLRKLETRVPAIILPFKLVLKILFSAVWLEKKLKCIINRKIKLLSIAENIIVYVENAK